jgi:tetratricopeptide (TPR) repeat protein
MKKSIIILSILASFTFISCKDYVTNIGQSNDIVTDSQLNAQDQLPFLITGVEAKFANAYGQTDVFSAVLSDAFFFDHKDVPSAVHVEFQSFDLGNIDLNDGWLESTYEAVGQCRYYADDLVRRTNSISITDTIILNKSLFTGYFYGGYARYLYATYFGLNPTQGGSPIDNGAFIGTEQMYDLAIDKFKQSLKYISDSIMIRTVNSIIARAYLYKGDYADAASYTSKGLQKGDPPFEALHGLNPISGNIWWAIAGNGQVQFTADYRFKGYIDADPNEANRIKIDTLRGSNDSLFYYQTVYPNLTSPQKVITWQENNLMLAELIIRGYGSGDALALVNEVRNYYGITSLSSVDLNVIYTERDKELFASGNRLVDERRFNKWHLPAGTWEYLPIPESERNGNPNIN